MAEEKQRRLTRAVQGVFLDQLAGTCNVRASARAAGIDPTSVYALRRRDARFAGEWLEALRAGYDLLETELVGHALRGGAGDTIEDGAGPVAVDVALKLLTAHRNAMLGKPHKGGTPLKRVTSEETDKVLLARLDAIERQRREAAG
ncbi:hypothetical protein P1X14_19235 [Sphingomonas sp. AOB5]|uniref:hypothetical protein n=1 Tax=Sphingomonas sp. AOB5 TaxID=3034017 RepID=UPI0023F85DBC|nr:hypothetical protein [Sphingomonas sp. AOB5]MDF7777399.1 hypothetical protein [Sphingomonas sp. AOB5]